jgi:ABC-type phosphate transport system substrate-binding protein
MKLVRLSRPSARRALRFALASAVFAGAGGAAAEAPTYQVVISAQNPVNELPRADVSKMFLKQLTKWPDGRIVVPVDQSANSDVRAVFCTGVHQRSPQAIQSYWQKEIFSRRGAPPFVKVGDDEVIAFVASNAAAIGYVGGAARIPSGLKVLRLKD